MSLIHDAKIEPTAFSAVVNGERCVECLQSEGNFKLDDLVTLREFTPATLQFTGRTLTAKIAHVEKASDNIRATLTIGEPLQDDQGAAPLKMQPKFQAAPNECPTS